jgi:hypothetical protein
MKRWVAASILLWGAAAAQDRRVPVVVELFTSEGCSSCPPAETLLARLERSQPVSGARVIALEEHVDYWNQLGWPDPFSSAQFRARQNDYALAFRVESIYTPQMVVNGRAGFVGDDSGAAYQQISEAAQFPLTVLDLKAARNPQDGALLDLAVHISDRRSKPRPANLYLAVTESDLTSNVTRGENAGRLLRHAPVVRSFGVIGKIDPQGTQDGQMLSTLRLPAEWRRENLRAVVFVQEPDTLRITGAATVDLR